MPTLTEEDVYTFEQLSDEAKNRARSDRREQEYGDSDEL